MDKTDLINLYKRPCYIFNSAPVSIEDDEILDLDSISLDSNEDTWLWSNSKGNRFKEVSDEELKNHLDHVSVDDLTDSSRISLSNWDSFKEQTVCDSFINSKTPTSYRKKLEFNPAENTSSTIQINGSCVNSLCENESVNLRKEDSMSNERDTFKKPEPKKDVPRKNSTIEKLDKNIILYSIENNIFANDHRNILNSDRKVRENRVSESSPICHSTPMLFKRRVSRVENENRSRQKSVGQPDVDSGDSPWINSSSFARTEVSDSPAEMDLVEAAAQLSVEDKNVDETFKIDDGASTSSCDSRRSSNSGNHIPRAVRTPPRPNSSNPRLYSDQNGSIRSPLRASSTNTNQNGSIRSPSRVSGAKKAPFMKTGMREPSRRAPSLNRLPTPSVNIDEEFVSVVEIKSKDAASKLNEKKLSAPNGPASHIPRPSTRIPVFRSSNSCTRPTPRKN